MATCIRGRPCYMEKSAVYMSLDRRLRELYQQVATAGMQRHRWKLHIAMDEDTPEHERERIFREVSQAIARDIEHASETAGELIEAESFKLFAKSYFAAAAAFALSRYYSRQELRLLYSASISFPGTPLPTFPKGNVSSQIAQLKADRARSEFYFKRALKRLGQSDTMTAAIMSDFREAFNRGEGVHKIARSIRDTTNAELYKAKRISQTECLRASNQGNYTAACHAVDEHGFQLSKTWHAAHDDRTRDPHLDASGQTVLFEQPFIIDGAELMYPLDVNAPPELTINCRCSASYRVVGFQKGVDTA